MKTYNFSRKHWGIIIFCFILYLLNNACTTDGENVFLPQLAAANGWDYTRVLMIASIAGCLSAAGQLLIGKICAKKNARFTIVICLFLTAGFVFMYGSAQHMWIYAIGLFGVICCSMSYSYIGANALVVNWFSHRNGIAMGFVSMGSPVSTMVMVSLLTILVHRLGLRLTAGTVSVILIIAAILCILVIRDKPEQCGELSEDIPPENRTITENAANDTLLSLKDILRMKETWFVIFIIGVCCMGLNGVMSQFVVRYTQSGFSETSAIAMMSVCAFIAIFGSMLMGNVEARIGTAKAYIIFALVFAAALLINFTNIKWLIGISIPMFGCVITILQIFLPSFEVSVYGRDYFRQANAFIFPVTCMIGQVSLLVISACISLFGEVRYAYLIFAFLFVISVFVSRKLLKS